MLDGTILPGVTRKSILVSFYFLKQFVNNFYRSTQEKKVMFKYAKRESKQVK